MSLDLVRDVFEPVAMHIQSECDSHRMRDFMSERYHDGEPRNAGIEGWFTVQVILALGDRVWWINLEKGPDLVLRDGDSTVEIELKAATNLNRSYLHNGATTYCRDYPHFAGCLFLGDGSDENKTDELTEGDFRLEARRSIRDDERTWIVGLLVSTASRGSSISAV